jgi:hypothetical protein
MKIIPTFKKRTRGYILLMVMFLCAASILILTGILNYTTTTSGLNMRSNQLSVCQNAAEAATEKVYAKMAADFVANGISQITNNLATYQTLVPTASDNSYFSQFNFYSPISTNAGYIYVSYLTNYSGPLPTQYTNQFASTNSVIYRIVSNVTMPSSYANNVIGTAQEDVLFALVPLDTYAIFYNGELEYSDCATMTVSGRTHSNADICTGSPDTLTFNGAVTSCSVIQSPERGGITYNPLNENVKYNAGSATDVVSIQLSIPMTNTHAIIQIPTPPTSETSQQQAATVQGQELEYYQAQVILIVTNSPSTTAGANPEVELILQTGSNGTVPGTDLNPVICCLTNATPALLRTNLNALYGASTNAYQNHINLPFLSLTNNFADQREHQLNMFVTQIDVHQFALWASTNPIVLGKIIPSENLFPTILYVADERSMATSNRLAVVRLVNAQELPYNNDLGFTVATQNPLYAVGHYNVTTNGLEFSYEVGATTNGFTVPAALLADSITVLSSNWSDSISLGHNYTYASQATPKYTTINAAIVTGNVPSTGTSATTYSGGVENLTRLLEDWTGVTLTYNTSIVCLYSSQMATNQFQMPGTYYEAPTRQWGFDPTFYNPARTPPGIPEALVPIRFNWLQPPPGSVTSGVE